LALSNALVQNANKNTINTPTKMLNTLVNEATDTSIVLTDLLRILLHEVKEPSSYVIIVDDLPKKGKN
jgi:hypothetical protein